MDLEGGGGGGGTGGPLKKYDELYAFVSYIIYQNA